MNIFDMIMNEKIYLPILIIIICVIVYLIISMILNNKISINKNLSKHNKRSRKTVLLLIKNIVRVVIFLIAIFSILQVIGVNLTALITGVSAITVFVGLVFQDLLKDILVGATIILESQYAIGEMVEINGFKGEVTGLNLKSTKLKALTGETRIISNRNISEITNYSLNSVLVKIIVSVSYEDDVEKVEKVLKKLCSSLSKKIDKLKDVINVEGIDSLSSSSVDFLLTTKTSAKDQFAVKRMILKEVKKTLDENDIKIPYPQVEVHNEK